MVTLSQPDLIQVSSRKWFFGRNRVFNLGSIRQLHIEPGGVMLTTATCSFRVTALWAPYSERKRVYTLLNDVYQKIRKGDSNDY